MYTTLKENILLKMSNQSVIQLRNQRQFVITLPKGLVLAKAWKRGDELKFVLDKIGNIIIKKASKNELSIKSSLQFADNRQFLVTLPKDLVLAKRWKKGDIVEFVLDDNVNIVMRKIMVKKR